MYPPPLPRGSDGEMARCDPAFPTSTSSQGNGPAIATAPADCLRRRRRWCRSWIEGDAEIRDPITRKRDHVDLGRDADSRRSQSRYSRSSEASLSYKRGTEYIPELRIAGGELLKEFRCNLGSWLTYSLHSPFPALSTLRLTCCRFNGFMYALTKWLPLAPNLQELGLTYSFNRFDADTAGPNQRIWKAAARGATETPYFVLPTLRTLSVWEALIPNFTCPALERYVMKKFTSHNAYLTDYLEFVKRSGAPPSFRTLEIRSSENPPVLGYFLPTITNLLITSPVKSIFTMLSERSQEDGVVGFSVLPTLEHLEITGCGDEILPFLSSLVTSRWDIGAPHRTLTSVKLNRCFTSSPTPELLLFPSSDGIDLTQVGGNWREIARCVNEGLLLSVCE